MVLTLDQCVCPEHHVWIDDVANGEVDAEAAVPADASVPAVDDAVEDDIPRVIIHSISVAKAFLIGELLKIGFEVPWNEGA